MRNENGHYIREGEENLVKVRQVGDFKLTEGYLKRDQTPQIRAILTRYGERGVNALTAATPRDSGETARSWYYEVRIRNGRYFIEWKNRNIIDGVPIAIILQYGHATGTGGYVQGVDYINPALRPIFDAIARDICKEVAKR